MRYPTLLLAAAIQLLPLTAVAQVATPNVPRMGSASQLDAAPSPSSVWTLTAALQRSENVNPLIAARLARLAAAEGARQDAGALFNANPELTLERTRRNLAGTEPDRYREWSAGISQQIEIAGQRGHRRNAADAELRALQMEIEALRREQRSEVARRFYRVLALQARLNVETRAAKLFEASAAAVEKRRAAGEDTRLDANVALVEAERARNQLAIVSEQLSEARAELAVPLQLPPGELPTVAGDLTAAPLRYAERELLATASTQPNQQALASREVAAQARLALERAGRYPDVTLGVSMGREGPLSAREKLTTVTLSVPLPLFKHNASAIGAARADLEQATVERTAAQRNGPAQIHALWMKLSSLRERIQRLQDVVMPALARNEELSRRSRQAGQIGLLEQLTADRQAVDARRDLIEAQLDYQETRLALETAAGWSAQP